MAVYYLDVDDEITSAASRLRDSADRNVALVIQGGSRVATSRINFKLLSGQARHYNRNLSIVAADAAVRSLAQTAGLPVYASVAEYQRSGSEAAATAGQAAIAGPTPPPPAATAPDRGSQATRADLASEFLYGPEKASLPKKTAETSPERPLRAGRAGSGRRAEDRTRSDADRVSAWSRANKPLWAAAVLVLILVVGGVAGYLLLPGADVVLTLHTQNLGPASFTVNVDPTITKPDANTMSVPALSRQFSVEANGTYQATGENVVDTAATGTVTFRNGNTGRSVFVASNTPLTTLSGLVFKTTASVTVPRAAISGSSIIFGLADAPVIAAKAGVSGNVPANAIVNVPASLATQLVVPDQVTNKSPTSGGTHTVTPFVQQADIQAAESDLQSQLNASLATQVANQAAASQDFAIFDQTAALSSALYEPDPAGLLNGKDPTFQLGASAGGSAMAARLADIQTLADSAMARKARAGFSLVAGSVEATIGQTSVVDGRITIAVNVSALQAPTIDVPALKSALAGKTAAQARTYLAPYGDATVNLSPFWVSTISGFDFRVSIQVVEPSPLPSRTPRPTVRITPAPPKTPPPVITPTPATSGSPEPSPTPRPSPTESPTAAPTDTPAATPTP